MAQRPNVLVNVWIRLVEPMTRFAVSLSILLIGVAVMLWFVSSPNYLWTTLSSLILLLGAATFLIRVRKETKGRGRRLMEVLIVVVGVCVAANLGLLIDVVRAHR